MGPRDHAGILSARRPFYNDGPLRLAFAAPTETPERENELTESQDSQKIEERASELVRRVYVLLEEVRKGLIGQDETLSQLVIAILAGGHVLLEGLPGLGKTHMVKSVSEALGLEFARIQFTPDLMPSDITGTRIVDESQASLSFRFQRGPIFANLVLADEINRTTPKTQAAMLEAMQEGTVTVADVTHQLPQPFNVIATQNPIELEGTYPLPEAQLDRFMFHLIIKTPDLEAMVNILSSTTTSRPEALRSVFSGQEILEFQNLARQVICGEHLVRYVAEILRATQPTDSEASDDTRRLVRFGASPRAGQAIILAAKVQALLSGRPSVAREDLDLCLLPALRHRVILTFEAEAEDRNAENMLPDWIAAARQRTR